MKVNRVLQQSTSSSNCGFHSILFLQDRFNGIPFKQCTGWTEVRKAEKRANRERKKWKKFEYV